MNRFDQFLQVVEDAHRQFLRCTDKSEVLHLLESCFTILNIHHLIISEIPMPASDGQYCIFTNFSKSGRNLKLNLTKMANDIVFHKAIDWPQPFVLRREFHAGCYFAQMTEAESTGLDLLVVPIQAVFGYQAVLVASFPNENNEDDIPPEFRIPLRIRLSIRSLCDHAFYTLKSRGLCNFNRNGQLTSREKEVVSLAALGRTSQAIAGTLEIAERTVIAHLQNASLKLDAKNRTECVIQAIRYHQIGPGAGRGFFQLDQDFHSAMRSNTFQDSW